MQRPPGPSASVPEGRADEDGRAAGQAPAHDRPGWPRRLAIAAVAIAVIGLGAACVPPAIEVFPWLLVEHFRLQFAAGGLALVVAAGLLRLAGWFDLAAIGTLIQVLWLAPDLAPPRDAPVGGASVRVLMLNVHTESSTFAEVRRLISDLQPDVIGLVEVDDRWLGALAPALAPYAGRLTRTRDDNFGVALYARAPFAGTIEEPAGHVPFARATVSVDGAPLEVFVVHPLPPVSAAAIAAQRALLDEVAAQVRETRSPVVVMGDLNATPWSTPFLALVAATGLCDSRAGRGIAPSFPAASAVLRIPIDHLLASCDVGVADRRVERDVGSDHLPIVADLVVPRGPRGPRGPR